MRLWRLGKKRDKLTFTMTLSRREFLVGMSAVSAVWLSGAIACRDSAPPNADTHEPDANSAEQPAGFVHFAPDDAADVEAIAARIFPTDDTPGAREAGVVYFIDRSMTTFAVDQADFFAVGLRDLNAAVANAHAGVARFAQLGDAQQDAMLRTIEGGEFFGAVRFATIAGMFALPKYGGNRDFIGWNLVDQRSVMEYKPPFGWYDHPDNQIALLGRIL